VDFLPTINWSQDYLDRIAADTYGDLDPTQAEIDSSGQAKCILYYNQDNNFRFRRSLTRTPFMYTLDRLGYQDRYDVYDIQGYGNTNNQLGSRANVSQCVGYGLIIQDNGTGAPPNLPDGLDLQTSRVDQATWYRNYLAQGNVSGGAPIASVWLIGQETAFEKQTNALIGTDFGLTAVVTDQALNVNPNVTGQGSFTFTTGNVANFATDLFSLNGGCPAIRHFDGATNTTSVITHKYTFGAADGPGAIIMNKNSTLNWNTVWTGFPWYDIRVAFNTSPLSGNGTPDVQLARKVLTAILPLDCQAGTSTGTPDPEVDAVPAVSKLHQNVPNPFNPTTMIKFDLARDGRVQLQVFDVAGHLVRTLVNGTMTRGFDQSVAWNGLDEGGRRVPSGVYFYQLVTDDLTATKKMVMLK
jgi:hypothetical protein